MKRFIGGISSLLCLIALIIMVFPGIIFIFYVSDQPSSSDGPRQLTNFIAWISGVIILYFLLKKSWKMFKGLNTQEYKVSIVVKIAGIVLGSMVLYYFVTSIPIIIALISG